jgi:hypothetical protein
VSASRDDPPPEWCWYRSPVGLLILFGLGLAALVLDNAGIRRSQVVRDARPALRTTGINLF